MPVKCKNPSHLILQNIFSQIALNKTWEKKNEKLEKKSNLNK